MKTRTSCGPPQRAFARGCGTAHRYAQNEIDITLQLQELRGHAHHVMGGAFGALGADLASLNGNPAGIGMYRRAMPASLRDSHQ